MSNSISSQPGARRALVLLLAINLFNYIDRYILVAVEPEIRSALLHGDPAAMSKAGLLATGFLVTYMLTAPLFGWLAGHIPRWRLIGASVALWSVATAASGWAGGFMSLLVARCLVGVGEAGYGPSAPTIIADLFPLSIRGRMMAYFYMAIPVGSAIGYALGGKLSQWMENWRAPFFVMAVPGLILAVFCFFMPEPEAVDKESRPKRATWSDYTGLLKNKSYVMNTLAMTALTFSIGGLSFWVPGYIFEYRQQPNLGQINLIFGGITVVAGVLATLLGGMLADHLRPRFPGSYFLVAGFAMLAAFPFILAFLFVPFPGAWVCLFFGVFCLFFNTGPSNTALANVTHPSIRAMAFAINILVIHALGDAISPPLIGLIADHSNLNVAFFTVTGVVLVASLLWIFGAKYLQGDTSKAEEAKPDQS